MADAIVGFTGESALRILAVGARGVVHMPQFNGKQEKVGSMMAITFNLRCPRNGKTDDCKPDMFGLQSAFIIRH